MKRKIFLVLSLCFLVIVLSACSQKKNEESEPVNTQNSSSTDSRGNWQDNFDTLSTNDLQVGKIVSVMAQQDSSGNLLAQTIMLAANYEMLENFKPGPANFDKTSSTTPQDNTNNSQGRERPDFNNLSDEDRARFEEMRKQRENGSDNGEQKRTFNAGMENLQGEILSLADGQLTLKLKAGGSKIVFLSQDTKILFFKQN